MIGKTPPTSDALKSNKSILKSKQGRKVLNVLYVLVGIFFACNAFIRLWEEGTFGNEVHVLFLYTVGPYIGFLKFFIGLTLAVGQALEFLDKKYSFQFSFLSFGLALILLVTTYFFLGGGYIWSMPIDFMVFTSFTIMFYFPIISTRYRLRKEK